jgi:ribosomal protein S18 acetylase RimI-like enzyme
LDGVRDTRDVLAGYQATGQFAPERWFFVQSDGADVGCLLLTDHSALRNWELVYMGLAPAARGRGWGTDLVRFAQWQTKQAGREALLVSVDAANGPAVAAYSRCGFSEIDRREVWIKKFASLS